MTNDMGRIITATDHSFPIDCRCFIASEAWYATALLAPGWTIRVEIHNLFPYVADPFPLLDRHARSALPHSFIPVQQQRFGFRVSPEVCQAGSDAISNRPSAPALFLEIS